MSKGALAPILLACGAILAGLPAYLVADRLRLLPPSLRDRPWPLDAVVLVATLGAAYAGISLTDRLGRRVALTCAGAAAASLAILISYAHAFAHELPGSSPEVSVGRRLPELSLSDEHRNLVGLDSLRGHPTVILFFRGVFCPACRAQVSKLAERAVPFLAAGVRVVGVSPDPPDRCAEWSRSVHLPFPLLSDENRRFVSDVCNATEHCIVVVDPQGIIRWGRLNESWREGPQPEAVLQSAYRLRR